MFRALILAALIGATAKADAPVLSETLQLRARIVQLESQLASERASCAARTLEREAGCLLDWSVIPVTCKAGK